jgi:lipopolysaccharide export LptBFGC system permease protein LptF
MNKKVKSKKAVKPELIRDVNEDTKIVKKFILLLIGLALLVVLVYFLSAKYIVKDKYQEETKKEETIVYNKINIGNIFNRPYDNYYVLIYESTNDKASTYNTLASTYNNKDTKKKLYTIDLSLKINNKYKSDKSNKKATKVDELSLKDITLIEIKNGKIVNYYDNEESITNILK